MAKRTTEQCIEEIRTIHSDSLEYSKVIYKNLDTKIILICPIHGEFKISPRAVLQQHQGCKTCGRERASTSRRVPIEKFINQANNIHNNKYDYTKAQYVNNTTKIIISCPIHGDFLQTPDAHVNQHRGCPDCKRDKLKQNGGGYSHEYFKNHIDQQYVPGILYVMSITNGNEKFIKIGITANSVQHRYNRGEYKNMEINTLCEKTMTLFEAFKLEQSLIEELKPYKFFPNSKFSGYTECLQHKPEVVVRLQEVFQL
ncbi:MAG: hypothetical protein CTY12_00130 [Methylotenera sp.]|nr:MAG: hypothetical protein CTY12_00130 [Methylotenera sp.]